MILYEENQTYRIALFHCAGCPRRTFQGHGKVAMPQDSLGRETYGRMVLCCSKFGLKDACLTKAWGVMM
jgi:hypothetical protein